MGKTTCPNCSAIFAKVQGLNAHKRHCSKQIISPEEVEGTVARNGNGKAGK